MARETESSMGAIAPGIQTNNIGAISTALWNSAQLNQKRSAQDLRAIDARRRSSEKLSAQLEDAVDGQLPWWGRAIVRDRMFDIQEETQNFSGPYVDGLARVSELEDLVGQIMTFDSNESGSKARDIYSSLIDNGDDLNSTARQTYELGLPPGKVLSTDTESFELRSDFFNGGFAGIDSDVQDNPTSYDWKDYFTLTSENRLMINGPRLMDGSFDSGNGTAGEAPNSRPFDQSIAAVNSGSIFQIDEKNAQVRNLNAIGTDLLLDQVKSLNRSDSIRSHGGTDDANARRVSEDLMMNPNKDGKETRLAAAEFLKDSYPSVFGNQQYVKAFRDLDTESDLWTPVLQNALKDKGVISELSKGTDYGTVEDKDQAANADLREEALTEIGTGWRQYVSDESAWSRPSDWQGATIPTTAAQYPTSSMQIQKYGLRMPNPNFNPEDAAKYQMYYDQEQLVDLQPKFIRSWTNVDNNGDGLSDVISLPMMMVKKTGAGTTGAGDEVPELFIELDNPSDWHQSLKKQLEQLIYKSYKGALTLDDFRSGNQPDGSSNNGSSR